MAGVLRHRTTRPRRITAAALLAGLLVLGSGWAGSAARAAPPAPAVPGSPGSAAVRAAAAALVRDARIPLPDAVAGVRRQGRQRALAGELAGRLGPRYGGAWIDWIDQAHQAHQAHRAHRGRLTVAVLDSAAAATVRRAARRAGLTDTVVVRVGHAAAALDRAARRLGGLVAAANRGAEYGLEASVAVRRNAVELHLPAGADLTSAQRRLVTSVRGRRDGPVVLAGSAERHVPQGCFSPYACDPPLRSGLAIYTARARCTSGFTATAAGRYYLLTAGHCAQVGSVWAAGTASIGERVIGPRAGSVFGAGGDMGLIGVAYPAYWRASGLVYPAYPIRSVGTALVGEVVCKSGSTTGLTCGTVTRTGATVYYPGRTVTGMTVTTACSGPGDSGAGVWAGSTAFGIVSGGPVRGCGLIYQPVAPAEAAFGVRVLAG